jgi:hypothetical protein
MLIIEHQLLASVDVDESEYLCGVGSQGNRSFHNRKTKVQFQMIKRSISRQLILFVFFAVTTLESNGQSAKRYEKVDTILSFYPQYYCAGGGSDFFCAKGKYLEEQEFYHIFRINKHFYFRKEVVHNDRLYNSGYGRSHPHAFKKIPIDTFTIVGLLNSIPDSISKETIKPFVYAYFDSANKVIYQQLYGSHCCIFKYNVTNGITKCEVEVNSWYLEQETSVKDGEGRILAVTKNDNYQYNSQLFVVKLLVSVQNLAAKLKANGQFILDR